MINTNYGFGPLDVNSLDTLVQCVSAVAEFGEEYTTYEQG